MRTLHIVTHPEATHHIDHVVGGWHDSSLTPDGLRAASRAAHWLRERVPQGAATEVYSSDLLRTRQTATAIGEVFDVEPVLDRNLREKSYGEAEGRPQEWLEQRFVVPPVRGDRLGHDEGIEGAETKGAWAQRVYAALDSVLARPCAHQIVVTHGGTLTLVVAAWIGMPVESVGHVSFPVPVGSVTTLFEDDRFHNRQVTALGILP
ncbi:histidine phosphatase family protein [Streptomyces sp. 4F14]|uniref:histidine phosphatase family protein n=1 Tax=Streptomyces sp. 4F14 TaxID=3394380 RepID=UPI003A8673DC